MEDSQPKQQTVSMWITSLAISVTCCAVLFVIFAGYLSDIKKNLANENVQLEQMAIHEDQLLAEIKSLQHELASNQASPAAASETAPVTTTAPGAANATKPVSPVVPSTVPSATTPVTPPPAAPTAIPEVPPKK